MSTDPVMKWLALLGALCANPLPEEEAGKQTALYAKMLRGEFETWAFCSRSLEAVARQSKFWPSYAELCERLSAWCKEHPPKTSHARLEGPGADDGRAREATDRAIQPYRAYAKKYGHLKHDYFPESGPGSFTFKRVPAEREDA